MCDAGREGDDEALHIPAVGTLFGWVRTKGDGSRPVKRRHRQVLALSSPVCLVLSGLTFQETGSPPEIS